MAGGTGGYFKRIFPIKWNIELAYVTRVMGDGVEVYWRAGRGMGEYCRRKGMGKWVERKVKRMGKLVRRKQ